jgi:hypothetical protein
MLSVFIILSPYFTPFLASISTKLFFTIYTPPEWAMPPIGITMPLASLSVSNWNILSEFSHVFTLVCFIRHKPDFGVANCQAISIAINNYFFISITSTCGTPPKRVEVSKSHGLPLRACLCGSAKWCQFITSVGWRNVSTAREMI